MAERAVVAAPRLLLAVLLASLLGLPAQGFRVRPSQRTRRKDAGGSTEAAAARGDPRHPLAPEQRGAGDRLPPATLRVDAAATAPPAEAAAGTGGDGGRHLAGEAAAKESATALAADAVAARGAHHGRAATAAKVANISIKPEEGKPCQVHTQAGEKRIGCRADCTCLWYERCYPLHMQKEEVGSIDVGVCELGVGAMMVVSTGLFLGLLICVFLFRLCVAVANVNNGRKNLLVSLPVSPPSGAGTINRHTAAADGST